MICVTYTHKHYLGILYLQNYFHNHRSIFSEQRNSLTIIKIRSHEYSLKKLDYSKINLFENPFLYNITLILTSFIIKFKYLNLDILNIFC